jgi:hypothetical protein
VEWVIEQAAKRPAPRRAPCVAAGRMRPPIRSRARRDRPVRCARRASSGVGPDDASGESDLDQRARHGRALQPAQGRS